jgi:hypothetical protein
MGIASVQPDSQNRTPEIGEILPGTWKTLAQVWDIARIIIDAGDIASRKPSGLSEEQIERAQWLWLSDERIRWIKARALEAQRIISLIDIDTPLNLYLHDIVKHFYTYQNDKEIFISQKFNKDIEELNAQIFTPEIISSGICFSTPFYWIDDNIDIYNIILW